MEINRRILPTPDMVRAARGYLNWSQHELGQRCNLSKVSLVGIESGKQKPNHETLKRIANVFWNEGLVFLEDGGFRVDNSLFKILEGNDGVREFFTDVYETIKKEGGAYFIFGRDQKFREAREKAGVTWYRNKMASIEGLKCKALIGETDINEEPTKGTEVRSLPPEVFSSSTPFFIYGNKLAIIFWGDEGHPVKIMVHTNEELVDSYRKQFEFIWKNAKK
jgi:DNA-binding XRE family transcriptional regulator